LMIDAEKFFAAMERGNRKEIRGRRCALHSTYRCDEQEFSEVFMDWLLAHPEKILMMLKRGVVSIFDFPDTPFGYDHGPLITELAMIIVLAIHVPSGAQGNLETERELEAYLHELTTTCPPFDPKYPQFVRGWEVDHDPNDVVPYNQIRSVANRDELILWLRSIIQTFEMCHVHAVGVAPRRTRQVLRAFDLEDWIPKFSTETDMVLDTTAMMVLTMSTVSDELTVARGNDDTSRFWRMAAQLPLDMQIVLATKYTNLCYRGDIEIVRFPTNIMRAADLDVILFLEGLALQ